MQKLPDCDRCHFNAHSNYIICALHPNGAESDRCPDFRPDPNPQQRRDQEALSWFTDELEPTEPQWEPIGANYYNGELVLQPEQRRSLAQKLELLDWHPLFTGRCPRCELPFPQNTSLLHWDCSCGWNDELG